MATRGPGFPALEQRVGLRWDSGNFKTRGAKMPQARRKACRPRLTTTVISRPGGPPCQDTCLLLAIHASHSGDLTVKLNFVTFLAFVFRKHHWSLENLRRGCVRMLYTFLKIHCLYACTWVCFGLFFITKWCVPWTSVPTDAALQADPSI